MLQKINRKNKSQKNILRAALLMVSASLMLMNFACGGNPSMQKRSNTNASPEVKLTAVERDIKSMQTANFQYIFVFRRKDGGVFDGEDRTFLKNNSPAETNRFVLSDDDKAVVAGSSFKFEPEVLKKLGERFTIENFSAPEPGKNTNVNQANDNKNINK